MRARVAADIRTIFACHYTSEISLVGALQIETVAAYGAQRTGEKFLVTPQA
jgi:hypothetical protein